MATIQARTSRGNKYYYVVESRRINGKPRPVVLAYLGKAEDIVKKLQGGPFQLKTYSHGLVASLYDKAQLLNIAQIIDLHALSLRQKTAKKPIRNGFTVGETIVLAAIGRACWPSSKQGWAQRAATTSLSHILQKDIQRLDSQHFWDHMDCVPTDQIDEISTLIVKEVLKQYPVNNQDLLLFDTTNFFTYIASANTRCNVAKRGKNKQKRIDLRQVGMALVVSKTDQIPLFHHVYEGNYNDYTVFAAVIEKIKHRMIALNLPFNQHTIVWDKGMNSKKNFALVDALNIHYVTSLKSTGMKNVLKIGRQNAINIQLNGETTKAYKSVRKVCGKHRTLIVFYSDTLKENTIYGIMETIKKKKQLLTDLALAIRTAKRKLSPEKRQKQIERLIGKPLLKILKWKLEETLLTFWIDEAELDQLQSDLGWKILATDRHQWTSAEIIQAYNGQATVEDAFKQEKDPTFLAFRPQFHWTDQKIQVHFLYCMIGHLLAVLLYKDAKERVGFQHNMHRLLECLSNIRLAQVLSVGSSGVRWLLEDSKNDIEKKLIKAFDIHP